MTPDSASEAAPSGKLGRVMGVLNVTPDSFFPGSRVTQDAAIARARQMIADGAAIVDVGGESTRPGAAPVDETTEIARVVPVIEAIADQVEVSIDTRHAGVARKAIAAGATIINDISSSLHEVAADTGAGWIAMHMQGNPQTMQDRPTYGNVVDEVTDYLCAVAELGRRSGIERVWIDPGIGFGKSVQHNIDLVAALDRLVATGWPVLLGVSRKSVIGHSHAQSDGVDVVPPDDRLAGSLALATWGYVHGVDIVRAHDVAETVRCAQVAALSGDSQPIPKSIQKVSP